MITVVNELSGINMHSLHLMLAYLFFDTLQGLDACSYGRLGLLMEMT